MSSKKKGKKGTTLSLQEFNSRLEDKAPGAGQNVIYASKKKATTAMPSWADEVEDDDYLFAEKERIVLPSAPRSVRGPAYDDSEIPREPPFSAHLGNLSYDIGDEDVYKFFRDLAIVELRLPRDGNSNRLRGFGHVEFESRQDLVEALIKNEQVLKGRPVRISLGSNNSSRNDDRRDRDRGDRGGGYQHHDDTPDDWRSAMQAKSSSSDFDSLPPPPSSNFGRRDGPDRRDDRRDRNMDRRDMYSMPPRPERDYDREGGGGGRRGDFDREGGRGRDFDRGRERSYEDEGPDDWRSSMRAREPPREEFHRPPPRERPEREHAPPPPPVFERRISDEHRGSPAAPEDKDNVPKEEPRQRKKLLLAPRSVPVPPGEAAPEAATASIFGGAKPVDTSAREREIEEKLAQASIKPKETTTSTTTDSPPTLERAVPSRDRGERERGGDREQRGLPRDRGEHRSGDRGEREHRGEHRNENRDEREHRGGSDPRGRRPPGRDTSREHEREQQPPQHHHHQDTRVYEREHEGEYDEREHDDREHGENDRPNGQPNNENNDIWLVVKNNNRKTLKIEKN